MGTEFVLQGTFIHPPGTTEATKYFLLACKYNPEVNSVINEESIATRYRNTKKLWGIRKEKTYTYGKHMRHYNAVMRHDWLKKNSKGGNTSIIGLCSRTSQKNVRTS